ncbi:MAG: hypothetical protein DI616_12260 [Paracoccus denitrificans]|uniref:Uncharacterized protein n=1 Tax=Paracoccus denitrificans TaxID=266 RepID=A0A533I568_PARDE|nr:MAG: hypothetical protein DI616_12260 [Paracoccus denitrificans]
MGLITADWLAAKIAKGIEDHGLPSTEVTAEQINWFENSFCMRLQIVVSPKEDGITDLDTLFSGAAGAGIYTAEDIAAERIALADGSAGTGDSVHSEPALQHRAQDATATVSTNKKSATKGMSDDPENNNQQTAPLQPANPKRFSGKPNGKGTLT